MVGWPGGQLGPYKSKKLNIGGQVTSFWLKMAKIPSKWSLKSPKRKKTEKGPPLKLNVMVF